MTRLKKSDQIWIGLRQRSLTPRQWAIRRGYSPSTVYAAIHGRRRGAISTTILRQLEEDLHAR